MVYLDDVSVAFSSEFELLGAGLVLNVDKCKFPRRQMEILGHSITLDGIQPAPDKVQTISSLPLPKTVKDLRRLWAC